MIEHSQEQVNIKEQWERYIRLIIEIVDESKKREKENKCIDILGSKMVENKKTDIIS